MGAGQGLRAALVACLLLTATALKAAPKAVAYLRVTEGTTIYHGADANSAVEATVLKDDVYALVSDKLIHGFYKIDHDGHVSYIDAGKAVVLDEQGSPVPTSEASAVTDDEGDGALPSPTQAAEAQDDGAEAVTPTPHPTVAVKRLPTAISDHGEEYQPSPQPSVPPSPALTPTVKPVPEGAEAVPVASPVPTRRMTETRGRGEGEREVDDEGRGPRPTPRTTRLTGHGEEVPPVPRPSAVPTARPVPVATPTAVVVPTSIPPSRPTPRPDRSTEDEPAPQPTARPTRPSSPPPPGPSTPSVARGVRRVETTAGPSQATVVSRPLSSRYGASNGYRPISIGGGAPVGGSYLKREAGHLDAWELVLPLGMGKHAALVQPPFKQNGSVDDQRPIEVAGFVGLGLELRVARPLRVEMDWIAHSHRTKAADLGIPALKVALPGSPSTTLFDQSDAYYRMNAQQFRVGLKLSFPHPVLEPWVDATYGLWAWTAELSDLDRAVTYGQDNGVAFGGTVGVGIDLHGSFGGGLGWTLTPFVEWGAPQLQPGIADIAGLGVDWKDSFGTPAAIPARAGIQFGIGF